MRCIILILAFLLGDYTTATASPTAQSPASADHYSKIGLVQYNPQWANYGSYLQRFLYSIEREWLAHATFDSKRTSIRLAIDLHASGEVTNIVPLADAESPSAKTKTCIQAIKTPSPYKPWSDEMKKMLGAKQTLVLVFVYDQK